MTRALVIGLGHALRGDDAIGLEVASALRTCAPDHVTVREGDGDASSLLDVFERAPWVVVVDAARGIDPGAIRRIDAKMEPLPHEHGASSHVMGLGAAVEMARALERLPQRLIVYGVGASTFRLGEPVSRPAREAIPVLVSRVLEEVTPCTSCR